MTYRTERPRGPWAGRGYQRWRRRGGWPYRHGDWRDHGRGCGSRGDLISRLERYQRDLEQRAADVAEKIRRLRAQAGHEGETESPEGADAPPTTPTTHNL